ncbi:MAG: metal-sensitive transcriptional regulator [Alphaproteobacteria bacterium]|nr:metal-sensitive transcriptional regulator [Alphaproteobacteria bacterium]MDE2111609.1 metal-sensitive transcriptional regulator [Alphaproteobacteria bacterium]MDE2494344.1 metal-sensitive transcriptional regulator [Alphaproteobacteria bacterium]
MSKQDPKLLTRLKRIEGQVRGVARMVEEDRYCIDILNQIQAVKEALKPGTAKLPKAYSEIDSPKYRRVVLNLVRQLAGTQSIQKPK